MHPSLWRKDQQALAQDAATLFVYPQANCFDLASKKSKATGDLEHHENRHTEDTSLANEEHAPPVAASMPSNRYHVAPTVLHACY
jgi:hypothetical protein